MAKKSGLTFLVKTFYATGHVLPFQAIVRALVDRGHTVYWLVESEQAHRVRACGAHLIPIEHGAVMNDRMRKPFPSNLTTLADVADYTLGNGRLSAAVADFRNAIATVPTQIDCFLIDAFPIAVPAILDLNIKDKVGFLPTTSTPWATIGVVPLYMTGHTVPGTLGSILSDPTVLVPCVNRERASIGLPPLPVGENDDNACEVINYSPLLHLQASCPELEFRSHNLPPNTHFVGPLVMSRNHGKVSDANDDTDKDLPAWWPEAVAHQCVVGITQGTFAVAPEALLLPAIRALHDYDGLLLVVVSPYASRIRDELNSTGTDYLKNVRFAEWLPYDQLIPQCKVLITNGGYGSVTQGLSHGVPLILAGTTEDKMDTAVRVVSVGAGINLLQEMPSIEDMRSAVRDILTDEKYAKNAAEIGKQLNSLGGAEKACHLLEKLVARCN